MQELAYVRHNDGITRWMKAMTAVVELVTVQLETASIPSHDGLLFDDRDAGSI